MIYMYGVLKKQILTDNSPTLAIKSGFLFCLTVKINRDFFCIVLAY